MLLHNILGLDKKANLYLPEDGYSSLNDLNRTLGFMELIAQSKTIDTEIRAVRDEYGHLVSLAVYNAETEEYPSFWSVFSSLIARSGIPSRAAAQFNHRAAAVLDSSTVTWVETSIQEHNAALREYFSLTLVNQQLCGTCVKPTETYEMVYLDIRIQRLNELFTRLGGRFDTSGQVLEICCGNGMATLSLETLGIHPLTTDYDRCQICQGLEHGVLKPERTIIMDATRLTHYFPEDSFDSVIGFMLGTIYSFNKDIWTTIMGESYNVVKQGGQLLFTVNHHEEMDILQEALDGLGAVGEVIDNTDANGIYDQWVYLGHK